MRTTPVIELECHRCKRILLEIPAVPPGQIQVVRCQCGALLEVNWRPADAGSLECSA